MPRLYKMLEWARKNLIVLLIAVSFLGVLGVGLTSKEPMVADEVVHYYMLTTQARMLPGPNIESNIPMNGWTYKRQYPHVFLWHYIGAIVWLKTGEGFWSVQLYQTIFWLQLLFATWMLAKNEWPEDKATQLVAVLGVASLPMHLLFSVLFFQDVPAAAQILTSILFLRRRNLLLSLLFMGLALSFKVTAFVFLPVYFALIIAFFWKQDRLWKLGLRVGLSVAAIYVMCLPMYFGLKSLERNYYPATTIEQYWNKLTSYMPRSKSDVADMRSGAEVVETRISAQASVTKPEIANHPGDLRIRENWIIYFGAVFWGLVVAALPGAYFIVTKFGWRRLLIDLWPLGVGGLCWLITAYHLRSAPDARFFIPGFPLVILSLGRLTAAWPKKKIWLPLLIIVSLLQGGAVLAKTASLRQIDKDMQQAIEYLESQRGTYSCYLMYPEGHERFIPASVHWDLNYELRDLWRGNNDERLKMLHRFGVDLVVVKKARIKDVPADTHDLGAYPLSFVNDISADDRFEKIFENGAVMIYRVEKTGIRDET